MKVFLDANILFSASDPASATHRLLTELVRRADVATSPHAWEEARRNLATKRPQLLPGLESLRTQIPLTHAFRLPPASTGLPDKDIPVLASAIGAACTHLWTSDQHHFGALYGRELAGIKIVSSLLLADALIADGWRP